MRVPDYLAWTNIIVALLGVLVALIGVAFAIFAFIEWRRLAALRKDMRKLGDDLRREQYQNAKATHRILASYALKDANAKIALLKSAVEIYPGAFNGWNALGTLILKKATLKRP